MKWAHSLDEAYKQIRMRYIPFLVVFFVIVLATYAFLTFIDFLPEPVTQSPEGEPAPMQHQQEVPEVVAPTVASPFPEKIIFDSLDKEVTVLNPQSREIADLDEALLSGVVRHPDSANFAQTGNILILGHSSYLPNVFNKNFQAFNGIQNLQWGDIVRVQSADMEYIYRVQDSYKAVASDVEVPHTPGEARLTLATCNSFGSKDDRFVVEAVLIDSKAL